MESQQPKDDRLWRIAVKRAEFRRNLYTYMVINIMLWAIWWFTKGSKTGGFDGGWPWPAWVALFWGIGLAFQYFQAYQGNKSDLAEEEYEKLKRKNQI